MLLKNLFSKMYFKKAPKNSKNVYKKINLKMEKLLQLYDGTGI